MEWWATYTLYAKMCPDREHRFSSFVPERSSPVRFCVRGQRLHNVQPGNLSERYFRFPGNPTLFSQRVGIVAWHWHWHYGSCCRATGAPQVPGSGCPKANISSSTIRKKRVEIITISTPARSMHRIRIWPRYCPRRTKRTVWFRLRLGRLQYRWCVAQKAADIILVSLFCESHT